MSRARISDIITLASRLTKYAEADIIAPNRRRVLSQIRAAIVTVAREQRPQYSYVQIGRVMGGRDHSTIIHAHGLSMNLVDRDAEYAAFLADLRELARTTPPFVEAR